MFWPWCFSSCFWKRVFSLFVWNKIQYMILRRAIVQVQTDNLDYKTDHENTKKKKRNLLKVRSEIHPKWLCGIVVSVANSCLTLCDRVDCSPPASSVHGILQARILEWEAMPSSRGSSQPRDWTCVSYVLLHWQAGSLFTTSATPLIKHSETEPILRRVRGRDKVGVWHWHVYTAIFKINVQQRHTI